MCPVTGRMTSLLATTAFAGLHETPGGGGLVKVLKSREKEKFTTTKKSRTSLLGFLRHVKGYAWNAKNSDNTL